MHMLMHTHTHTQTHTHTHTHTQSTPVIPVTCALPPETGNLPDRQEVSPVCVCEVRREEEVMSDGSRSELSHVSTYGRCGAQCKVHT